MDRHVAHALKGLSYHIPLETQADVATTAGSRDVDIATPTDRVKVLNVEYPVGNDPRSYQHWWLSGDTLTLLDDMPDGSDCRVYYGKLHTMDEEGTTLPAYLEDLLSLGAQAYALQAYASYAVDRTQPDYAEAQAGALKQSRQLLDDFRSQARRIGHTGKVRRNALYAP
ncbi:MAG: hypothetical protein NTU41_04725 [Chloroflexi bacterium]|nr:hypothetical protein [Chloroflexota bacterium]